MDSCRILLAGKNKLLIDHIFLQLDNDFECMTTSTRPDDIINHLNAIRYDAFIYCVQQEDRDDYQMIMGYKDTFLRKGTSFIVAGYKEECDLFQKTSGYMATNTYTIPLAVEDLKKTIKEVAEKNAAKRAALEAHMGGSSNKSASASPVHEPEKEAERKRILVVDDDPMVLKLVKGHLGEEYDIASAISGKIVYKFLENKKVDLILLDYEMPEENGPMVYSNIRKMDSEVKNVPIVFLTGVREKEKLVTALALRPNGYLPKPINGEKLISTVSKFLS